jgi:hypothetical protein
MLQLISEFFSQHCLIITLELVMHVNHTSFVGMYKNTNHYIKVITLERTWC